jgi:acyl carrier protein
MGQDTQLLEQIEATLRDHVAERYAGGSDGLALEPEDELLDTGVVDSMGVIELSSFLEETFGVTVELDEVVPGNFRSVGAITRYVAEKRGIQVDEFYVVRVRSLVAGAVPEDSVVLVVSYGDDALLALNGRRALHFPRDERGDYMPSKPADGAEAIAQLEAQRSQGATHIVFPQAAMWWLDEYEGLREYLETGEVARNGGGVVYALPAA